MASKGLPLAESRGRASGLACVAGRPRAAGMGVTRRRRASDRPGAARGTSWPGHRGRLLPPASFRAAVQAVRRAPEAPQARGGGRARGVPDAVARVAPPVHPPVQAILGVEARRVPVLHPVAALPAADDPRAIGRMRGGLATPVLPAGDGPVRDLVHALCRPRRVVQAGPVLAARLLPERTCAAADPDVLHCNPRFRPNSTGGRPGRHGLPWATHVTREPYRPVRVVSRRLRHGRRGPGRLGERRRPPGSRDGLRRRGVPGPGRRPAGTRHRGGSARGRSKDPFPPWRIAALRGASSRQRGPRTRTARRPWGRSWCCRGTRWRGRWTPWTAWRPRTRRSAATGGSRAAGSRRSGRRGSCPG